MIVVALAFGLVLVGLIYAFGPISGAHLNPAVTFAAALRGRLDWTTALVYWIAQFVGGVLAAAIFMGGGISGASLNPARSFGPAIFTAHLDVFWIYLVGPMIGGGLAALAYRGLK